MVTETDGETLTIPSALAALTHLHPNGAPIISLYIDVPPARRVDRAYLLAFRDLCKATRHGLSASEIDEFNRAAAHLEAALFDLPGRARGIALFGRAAGLLCPPIPLPRVLGDHLAWDTRPGVAPLEQVLDDSERVAILLIDAERARLFTTFLGEIAEKASITDWTPQRIQSGGWAALEQSRIARHRDERLIQHVRHAIAALLDPHRIEPFNRLLVGGPDEARSVLVHHLPRSLRARLAGTIQIDLAASPGAVLTAAGGPIELIERAGEMDLVRGLFDAASSARVALGLAATLGALSDGRVHLLVLADSFERTAGECPRCGRLAADIGTCPVCGSPLAAVPRLRERMLARAREQDARIEIVSGAAADRLENCDGVGAWARY